MPTTLVEVADQLREAFGLTPAEARSLIVRLVPTLQIAAVSEVATSSVGANAAIGRIMQSGVAAQFSHCQLFNPATSGALLFVSLILTTTTATTDVQLARFDTQLTTAAGAKQWADFRRSGAPVGDLRREGNVAQLGTVIAVSRIKSDDFGVFTLSPPIVLAPGQGLLVGNAVFNIDQNGSFFWIEERA